jgi:uncharacterized protein YaaR (DUF327 family)
MKEVIKMKLEDMITELIEFINSTGDKKLIQRTITIVKKYEKLLEN